MRDQRGFTLIEVLVVLTVIGTIAVVGYLISTTYLRSQVLTSAVSDVKTQIIAAQQESYLHARDQAHGVAVFNGQSVHFVGDSYASRDSSLDMTIPLPGSVTISGDTEVVFTPTTLEPDQETSMHFEISDRAIDLTITSYGTLEVTEGTIQP